MIALVDYGAGNLTSVRKALTALGADFVIPSSVGDCAGAETPQPSGATSSRKRRMRSK